MFVRLLTLIIAALVAATPALAQDTWYDENGPAPPHPSRALRDGFGAMLMLTADRDAFVDAWLGPTPPNLAVTNETARNQPIYGMIIFRGCRAGGDGNCNVIAEYVILKPDGTPVGGTMRGPIWNQPPMPESHLQLGVTGPSLEVEPHDPRGTYLIRAIVTDQVAGISLEIEQELTVDTPATSETI